MVTSQRGKATGPNKLRVNKDIKISSVRVIDHEGNQLGILNIGDAILKAEETGLDLVEVAPNSSPPVCKILDFGKFMYEASKKTHMVKAAQKAGQLKEIKFRPFTDTNDKAIKIKKISKFLLEGNKVKILITYRGRERTYQMKGLHILNDIFKSVSDIAIYDMSPKSEGSSVVMILSPKSGK